MQQPPMQQPPMQGPPQQPAPAESASGMAVLALLFGILTWVGGWLLTAIAGVIVGKMEMNRIRAGESPQAGMTYAQIGFWASLVNIVLTLVAGIGLCCLYGGLFANLMGDAGFGGR